MAGRALSMSSQLVGKHIAALEERLGVQLLVRDAEEAEAAVAEFGRAPRGQLTIRAHCTLGSARLMPFIADCLVRHAEVSVKLVLIGTLENSSLVACQSLSPASSPPGNCGARSAPVRSAGVPRGPARR